MESTKENEMSPQEPGMAQKTNLWLPKGKVGGSGKLGGINRYALLYIKEINNKDLLYSTGNYIWYLVINYKEKEYMYITESLCCLHEINTVDQLYFN